MTTTTAWQIWYPTDSEPVAPLEGLFQEQADSVALALTTLQSNVSYAVTNQAARDALYPTAPPVGTKVWRKDSLTEEIYLNATYGGTAGWKPFNSVPRGYGPSVQNLVLGSGSTIQFKWWITNGQVHMVMSGVFGSGAGWADPYVPLPYAAATWFDHGSALIGYGQLDNTEENPSGRYMLGGIYSSQRVRIGSMSTGTGGGSVGWGGLVAGALGIDSGDHINLHVEYPAF